MGVHTNHNILPTVKTEGVAYLLMCQCNCFYVGKTKLDFFKSAGDLYESQLTLTLSLIATRVDSPKYSFLFWIGS